MINLRVRIRFQVQFFRSVPVRVFGSVFFVQPWVYLWTS